ncbi:MAG: EAL domain-containing protein [Tildeniella torsiva UHER 1998/13D]|jgi:diguanylate cyclase (GGDEF)-like protein/PAS domain S-box-containing protein|nr:EAL domain-containing protein [Tildeniella torsiva UHER 1998/13D]
MNASPPHPNVLIVDDIPENLRLLSATLSQQGYEVQCAISGVLALTGAQANRPDIILLDIKMPQMDGFEVCRRLKADPTTQNIPVIFLSALDDAFDKVRAFQAGGVDYITKPFQVEEVVARVEHHLALQRARAEILSLNAELEQRVEARTQALTQLNADLQASEARFRIVANAAPVLIWMSDIEGLCQFVNQSWLAFTGRTLEQALGHGWAQAIHPADRVLCQQTYRRAFEQRQPFTLEYRLQTASQDYRWLLGTGMPLFDLEGEFTGFIGAGADIHDRKQTEEQLLHNALHDSLTDLPNRALLMERLDLALNRVCRYANRHFAVLFLDLDRFKLINDSLGHGVGDQLLIEIATRLETMTRPVDLLARLGGDEFVLLLEDIEGVQEAVHIATRILDRMRLPFAIAGRDVVITTSIGIVPSSPAYREGAELLRDADTAMYQAKNQGKARYEIFNPGMHQAALKQLQLESSLRQALKQQLFVLYYQPIVDLKTQTITGLEALVRWPHPTQGLISPDEFIPLAEETGLIVTLGLWILQEACRQTRQWQQQFNAPDLTISVNLSAKQIKEPNFLDQVDQVLASTALAGHSLTFEITESMLIEDADSAIAPGRASPKELDQPLGAVMVEARPLDAIALMDQLRARHIDLDIDDFGTGYSSLSYLRRFPIHALKIDRSFTQDLATNADIVQAIITLGHALKTTVIAEGIETQAQMTQLNQLGCDYGQGYYLGRPLPAEATERLLASLHCQQWQLLSE